MRVNGADMKGMGRALIGLCSLVILACGCSSVDEGGGGGQGGTSGGIPCLVAAHYLMWWQPGEGGQWESGTIGEPLLGRYNSRDRGVIAQHIDWAADHGIDVFCIQWSDGDDDDLIDRYLESPNVGKLQFSIFYDCEIRFGSQPSINFDDGDVYETFLRDLRHFINRYSGHSRYFRISGRPVIWLFAAGNFTGRWRDALAEIRNWAASEGHPEPYLIGDMMWGNVDQEKQERASHFSAVFAYTNYHPSFVHGQSMQQYAAEMTAMYYQWRLLSAVPVYPPVFPSFNDTAFRSGNPPIESQSQDDFRAMCEMGRQSSDKMPGSNLGLVFVASWNEWHEGTTVEPTERSGSYPRDYGFGYLEVIRDVMKR